MEKVTLDWKAPSERKMYDLVGELPLERKTAFAKECTELKENKRVMKKTDAKKWIKKEFEGKDRIEWKNLPKGTNSKPSISDGLEKWFNGVE